MRELFVLFSDAKRGCEYAMHCVDEDAIPVVVH